MGFVHFLIFLIGERKGTWRWIWASIGLVLVMVGFLCGALYLFRCIAHQPSGLIHPVDGLSISPRGDVISVVYLDMRGQEVISSRILLIDIGTKQVKSLTKSGVSEFPTWNPSGEEIAFAGIVGVGTPNIWIADVTGKRIRQLLEQTNLPILRVFSYPQWSPKGDSIAIVAHILDKTFQPYFNSPEQGLFNSLANRGFNRSLNVVQIRDGAQKEVVIGLDISSFAWGWVPESQKLLYVQGGDLWSVDLDGLEKTQLTHGMNIHLVRIGRKEQKVLLSSCGSPAQTGFWIMDIKNMTLRKLSEQQIEDADWSWDEQRLIYSDPEGWLWLQDIQGTPILLTREGGNMYPRWVPNNEKIVYVHARKSIRLMDLSKDDTSQVFP